VDARNKCRMTMESPFHWARQIENLLKQKNTWEEVLRSGLCVAAATAAALLGCAQASRAADTYDINVVLPLTGGKTLRFVFHDDQTSPQVAVQLANQIKASKPPVVLGSAIVAQCNAMAPLMRDGPLLYCFSPGIAPTAGSYLFSSSISTKELAGALLRYFGKKGWKRVGLITSTDATGQDANRNFKALVGSGDHKDVELVADAQFNPTDVSTSAQIPTCWWPGPPAGRSAPCSRPSATPASTFRSPPPTAT
jgi:branched-chain amino acid transport system substrate-binding protein